MSINVVGNCFNSHRANFLFQNSWVLGCCTVSPHPSKKEVFAKLLTHVMLAQRFYE